MAQKTLRDYPHISLLQEDIADGVDFTRIFTNMAPVQVEIGCGRGAFIVKQALAQPDNNFLGVEYTNKVYRYSIDRAGRWGLKNARIIRTDALDLVANKLQQGSISALHIYFPDPWPKKKHLKRRFFSEKNLPALLRCLGEGGRIQLATDHADYFAQMKAVIEKASPVLAVVDFIPPASAAPGEFVGSNYERKYKKENRPTFTIAAVKKS